MKYILCIIGLVIGLGVFGVGGAMLSLWRENKFNIFALLEAGVCGLFTIYFVFGGLYWLFY